MKKLFFYASLVCVSLMWSCSKEYAVDEENLPEWLGESIYAELKNPKLLDGTFNTYLRLVDYAGFQIDGREVAAIAVALNLVVGVATSCESKYGQSREDESIDDILFHNVVLSLMMLISLTAGRRCLRC